MKPLIVVEGDPAAFRLARRSLTMSGWTLVEGFEGPVPVTRPRTTVRTGVVDSQATAAAAVVAALQGHGLLLLATADRRVLDLLYEDLRHLGSLDLRTDAEPRGVRVLTPEEQDLLRLLLAGQTLAQAANTLSMSVRTADRRVAAARRFFGVTSTAAALRAAREHLD